MVTVFLVWAAADLTIWRFLFPDEALFLIGAGVALMMALFVKLDNIHETLKKGR